LEVVISTGVATSKRTISSVRSSIEYADEFIRNKGSDSFDPVIDQNPAREFLGGDVRTQAGYEADVVVSEASVFGPFTDCHCIPTVAALDVDGAQAEYIWSETIRAAAKRRAEVVVARHTSIGISTLPRFMAC